MDTNKMRIALKEAYPRAGWAEKVKIMSDEQVLAIYMRLKKDSVLDKPRVKNSVKAITQRQTYLFCPGCQQVFSTDNPDTSECIFCGSKRIMQELPTTRIEKENENEDF